MTPETYYQQDLTRKGFSYDPAQANAVKHLQRLYEKLCADASPTLLQQITSWFGASSPPVKGLFFWGGVGRGKTYLMDAFYHSLPFNKKMRMHFHHFMGRIHNELTGLEGQKNPLGLVADRLSKEARIICFDEFFVSDIADAMILAGLLEQLFSRGVALVVTSNVEPKDLYLDGLQRARFLPAIDLINTYTTVVHVDGGTDYRLRLLEKADTYYSPLTAQTHERLNHIFLELTPDHSRIRDNHTLNVLGRNINSIKTCEDIGWFTFSELCNGPRSQNDYIELASVFHSIILTEVPKLDAGKNDQCRRFIALVDEFYDRSVKLIISAETTLDTLYDDSNLSFEFRRTLSRLQEMQSTQYLARPHKA